MAATPTEVMASLKDLCVKGRAPLSDVQVLLLAGAVAVWLEKAREEGREEVREAIGGPVAGYLPRHSGRFG
jgi:hypothetical protein